MNQTVSDSIDEKIHNCFLYQNIVKLLNRILPLVLMLSFTLVIGNEAAYAVPTTFTCVSGDLLATVDFEIVAGDLEITLTNTSPNDVLLPVDVLTGTFFNIVGDPNLSKISAILSPGSVVVFESTADQPAVGGVVGGEWAYTNSLGGPNGENQGIGAAGFGLFGVADNFPGPDLDAPENVDGLMYGILSTGDDITTGNTPVTGNQPLIQDSVQFTLGNLPGGFSINDISDVFCQYGTSLSPGIVGGHGGPIDKTALMVTGAQLNASWMIPVLISAIGIGVFVVTRKS